MLFHSIGLLSQHSNIEQRIKSLGDQCFEALFLNADSAEAYCEEALELVQSIDNDTLLALAYNDLGLLRIRQSRFSEALELNNKALKIRKALGLKRDIGASLSKIGVIYTEQGKFEEALPLQQEALKYFISAKDSNAIGQTYNNLSFLMEKVGNLKEALGYTLMSIDILEKTGNKYSMVGALGNISTIYEKTGKYEMALASLEKSVEICKELGLKTELAGIYNNLGYYHRLNKNYTLGKAYYETALELAKEIRDTIGMVQYTRNLAHVELEQGLIGLAEKHFLQALQMAGPRELLRENVKIYQGLAGVYKEKGDFTEAFKYRSLEARWNDSLFGMEKFQVIQELQTKFETERKEKEIAHLAKEEAEAQFKLAKQQNWSMILGLLAFFSLLSLIVVTYVRKKKAEAKAAVQETVYRKELLQATIEAQEEERQRMARDLHDGLVQSLVGIKIGLQNIHRKISSPGLMDDLKKQVDYLDHAASEARSLSHQMMPRTLREKGLSLAMDDMLEKTLKVQGIQYSYECFFEQAKRFPAPLEIGLYRIAQELVNNIMKHSGATHVEVQMYTTKSHLILHMEDNGKGMDNLGKGEGIGLGNIRSRATVLNGEATYDRAIPGGTVANVRVPLDFSQQTSAKTM